MAESTEWIITIAQGHDPRQVASALAAAGAQVGAVLEQIGCVVVRADAAVAAGLRQVKGVADVSPSAGVDIGPPGGDPNW